MQPDREAVTERAMAVHGLSMERLAVDGAPPAEAMARFAEWVAAITR